MHENIEYKQIIYGFNMRSMLFMVALATGLISGCTKPDENLRSARQPLSESLHTQRMLLPQLRPVITVAHGENMQAALSAAAHLDPDRLANAELSRWAGVDALPLLSSTATGRKFLAAAVPRALAQGVPAEFCPALALAAGTDSGPDSGTGSSLLTRTVARALSACLEQLDPAATNCGCRIVALGNILTIPREDTAYATGTTARMRVAALGIDLVLVAEDGAPDETLLRDLAGPVARLSRGAGDKITLWLLADGHAFNGASIPVGFRRGRLAERIYATDADGIRMSLLIGFDPDELAQYAGAWLAWPAPAQPKG